MARRHAGFLIFTLAGIRDNELGVPPFDPISDLFVQNRFAFPLRLCLKNKYKIRLTSKS
jgi:hypothetical protein